MQNYGRDQEDDTRKQKQAMLAIISTAVGFGCEL